MGTFVPGFKKFTLKIKKVSTAPLTYTLINQRCHMKENFVSLLLSLRDISTGKRKA